MRVLITGIDGYLGFPLALSLGAKGHEVAGIDNGLRRQLVDDCNSQSAIPIASMLDRAKILSELFGSAFGGILNHDLHDTKSFEREGIPFTLKRFNPDAIIYLGEMPSAPFSMRGAEEAHFTQKNNVLGTLNTLFAMQEVCPDAHLIKLGTLGEYGTPDCDIPEGHFPKDSFCDSEFFGRKESPVQKVYRLDGMSFPKRANSWYHLSKVHDSNNIEFACRNWGLRSTDIMQGVVYGTRTDEMYKDKKGPYRFEIEFIDQNLRTRFDFDECFGTAIHRFCAQAVAGLPITVHGQGLQKRGFLPLRDSIQCLNIALENPPEKGEYRVFNQFEEVYSILELARAVEFVANTKAIFPKITHIENPRNETAEHYYNPVHQKLFDLGYKPTNDLKGQIAEIIEDLIPHRQRILDCKEVLTAKIGWDGTHKEREELL